MVCQALFTLWASSKKNINERTLVRIRLFFCIFYSQGSPRHAHVLPSMMAIHGCAQPASHLIVPGYPLRDLSRHTASFSQDPSLIKLLSTLSFSPSILN